VKEPKQRNVYEINDYQRAFTKDHKPDISEGYEVYVYKFDTTRKMLKYFWDNGKVQVIAFFIKNKKDGLWIGYHENGQKSFEKMFSKGVVNGDYKIFDTLGRISAIENYISDTLKSKLTFDTLGHPIKKEIFQ
jgi:antitoxin component YwqK of YwqJK toxin-antitoxin module